MLTVLCSFLNHDAKIRISFITCKFSAIILHSLGECISVLAVVYTLEVNVLARFQFCFTHLSETCSRFRSHSLRVGFNSDSVQVKSVSVQTDVCCQVLSATFCCMIAASSLECLYLFVRQSPSGMSCEFQI